MKSSSIFSKTVFPEDVLLTWIQRALIIGLIIVLSPMTLETIVHSRDGAAYLNMAKGFIAGNFRIVPPEDTQFFIGYPWVLSFFLRFLQPWLGVYLFQFLCLAGIVHMGRRFFEDVWVTRWFVFCVPSFVLFTSLNMSEAFAMLLFMAALLAYKENRLGLCSFSLGFAAITRPQTALFLISVLFLHLILSKKYARAGILIFMPALFCLGMFLFNYYSFSDPLWNFKLYGRHEPEFLGWPFQGLITYSLGNSVRLFNKLYVLATAAICLGGLFCLGLKIFRGETDWTYKIVGAWCAIQMIFLMTLNSRWAYLEMTRYLIPVFPGVLMGFEDQIPKKMWATLMMAAAAGFIAVAAEATGNR